MVSVDVWIGFGGFRQDHDILAAASVGRLIVCGLALPGKGKQNWCNLQPAMVDSAAEADRYAPLSSEVLPL